MKEEKYHYDALIGFSCNPEILATYDSSRNDEKLPLDDLSVYLSGSSGDVAIALSRLGRNACLFGLTGIRRTLSDELLDYCLKRTEMCFHSLRVLNTTSVAVLRGDKAPNSDNRVCGRRGVVLSEHITNEVEKLSVFIKKLSGPCLPVITGLKDYELPFYDLITKERRGVLNPNFWFCKKEEFKSALVRSCAIFLNHKELVASGFETNPIAMHLNGRGPRLIVVTNGPNGGFYSLDGQLGHYEAMSFTGQHYTAGAGDWFLGGFLAKLFSMEISVEKMDQEALIQCLRYGALVAGKKVLYAGAANGPSIEDLF